MGNTTKSKYAAQWEESRKRNEEREKNSSSTSSKSKYAAQWAEANKRKIASDIELIVNSYNDTYTNANNRYSNRKENSYVSDSGKYLKQVTSSRDEYLAARNRVQQYLDMYGDYYDKEFVDSISSFLNDSDSGYNSIYDYAEKEHDYWSQWEDEDAFNRDYDNYTYTTKYKGYSYADLMKAKAEIENQLIGNQDGEAIGRELAWINNHKTDRQFVDTMSEEELKQLKNDYENNKKMLSEKKLALVGNDYAVPQADFFKSAFDLVDEHVLGNKYYTYTDEYNDYVERRDRLQSEIDELEGITDVLYTDEDGAAITIDTLLSMRAADEKFNMQNVDVSVLEKDLETINKALDWVTPQQVDSTQRELDFENSHPQAKADMDYLSETYNIDSSASPVEVMISLQELQKYALWRIDKANYAEKIAADESFAKEHPVLATVKSILTAPLPVFEYAGNVLSDNSTYFTEYGANRLVNIYDDKHTIQNQVYQDTVSNLINDYVYDKTDNELGAWLASTAYSGVTSVTQSALTTAACTLIFREAGPAVALSILGTEAAASSYHSAIMNGSTNGEALTTSLAAGIGEVIFEKIPLDNLLKVSKSTDVDSMAKLLKGLAKQSAIEGLEEGGTEIWNAMSDAIINGDHSAYNIAVDKYMKMGYSKSDAQELASKDWLNELLTSMVGGAFGGGASGAVSGGMGYYNTNNYYKQVGNQVIEQGNVGNLVGQANTLMNGSKSLQRLADKVAGVKTEDRTGGKYARNVGKLQTNVQKAQLEGVKHADRVAFKSMVKAELKNVEGIKNIDNVAEIITKANYGTLTSAEQRIFDKFDGQKIMDKVANSEDLDTNIAKTYVKNANNLVKTSALTVSEKEAIAKYTGYDISDDGKTYIDATDEEVSIKNFKSVSGGDIVVELDNGSSISVGELRVDSDIAMIAKGLDSLNSVFSIDAQAANYIYDLWTGTENVKASDFMDGMRSAMALAKTNNVKGLETDANTKELPETLRKAMFDVARNIEESKTQARQSAIDKAVESRRESKKGKARAEGTGTVKYDGIKASDLNSKQKAQADFLSTIFTTMGINVEFFASPVKDGKHVGESGLYRPRTNTIRIDIFAGAEGEGLMLYTASHELTHFIREWSPAKFKKFADFLMENYNDNNVPVKQLIQAKINNSIAIAKEDKTRKVLTYDQAYEEVVADACERFLADSNAKDMLVALAQQDQTLAQKILKWIKDFANLIKNALDAIKGLEPDSRESAYVQEMTDVLEGLRYLWDEALFDAMESYQWVGERVNQNEIAGIDYDALEAAKNENGEELLQIRAIQHDVPEYRALLEKYGTLNKVEIDNLFNTMEKAFAIIEENLEILDYAWDENLNEDGTWDDSTDARAFKPVKPNSDKLYKYSLDFSTLCRKRLLQQVIVEELSMALDRAVTKAESIAIRDELIKLQEEGRQLEIACALCYVESARMKSPEQIQKFLNDAGQKVREFFAAKAKNDVVTAEENIRKKLAKQYATEIKEGKMPSPTETTTTKSGKKKWISLSSLPSNVAWEIRDAKREAKASYNPTAEEQKLIDIANALPTSTFTTAEGLKNLAKEHPIIFDAYTSFVRNATHSKGTEKDVWYRVGDADVIGDDLIAAMNKENGLRSQSWSDFQVIHLLDYVGAIIELSTKQAKMQSYTKVEDYVNLMGLTNMMINLSLIPTSEFNGKLDFDSVEGMGMKIALELRDKYPSTAGTISIGVADEQIKMLLESMDIDYVIPYHQSGMKQAVRKVMHIPTWVSYENYQGEKKITSRKDAIENANKYGVKLLPTSDANYHKAPNFSEWFDLELARKTAELENLRPSDAKAKKKYGVMYGGYKAMQEAADNYIKLCAERGLQPKFSYGKGDFSMESNYWKLLIDRKMINQKTGEIIEQKAVKPIFHEGEVLDILNNEIARYEGVKEDFDYATHYVVERFLNGDMNEHINDIAKHIGETVNNVTKVAAVDVDIKRQDRDSEGRNLTKEQAEYFKDSKVRDADGNLLVVRHGTDADFNIFDFSKAGKNGKAEGYGFYFSDDKEITNRYGNNQMEVYLNITKPMLDNKRTVTKSEMIKLTNALIDYNIEKYKGDDLIWQDSFISGYVNTYERGMSRTYAVQKFVNQIWEYCDNDQDLIFEVAQADGDLYDSETAKEFYDVLTNSIGYDGIISEWEHEDGTSKVYVAFNSNQAKRTSNLNPTENEDIRYQDRVTPAEDAEYLELAKNPKKNEARLRELVDAAAKKSGYTTRTYHGTNNFGFTRADVSKSDDGISFFATDSEEAAGTYSGTEKTKNISEASKEELYNNEMIVENIYDKASNFVDYCNRTLGIQDFVDLDYFKIKIQECLNDFGNGSSLSDVTGDFFVFCDELFYGFIDNYYSVHYNENVFADKTTAWSDETKKLSDNFYNYVNKIIQEFQQLKSTDTGIYGLYANTEGLFEIDAQGKRWNAIPFDRYDTAGFNPIVNTRQVARYAKAEGYKGVKIENVYDDGGRGVKNQSKPATVYIFFNPQEQVKSADLVTYDDEGNIIPLSERFNEGNEDIRYSERYIEADTNSEIVEMISKVINGEYRPNEKVTLQNVPSYIAKRIEELTGINVEGFKSVIEARQIAHILKDHGENGESDQSMKNPEDLGKMEYVLAAPDEISLAGKTRAYTHMKNGHNKTADTILYEKVIGKKSYYVVQAVPDTKAKTLYIVTAFIGKSGYKKEAPQLTNAKNLGVTSKDGSANASVDIISNSKENVNTKFQDRAHQVTLDDLGIDYKAENEKYKADIERLKELLKFQKTLTHGTAFSSTSVSKAASMLMQKFGMHRGKDELAKMLNEYYRFIAQGEDLSWEAVMGKAEDIAKWIDSQIVRKAEIDEHSKEILSYIRALRIKLDDTQKGEVAYRYGSYEAFRKANMGSVILTDKGTELDSIWQDLAERYPDVFDVNANAADMPIILVETIADLRTADKLLEQYDKNGELRWMAEEIYDSYWNVSTVHSLADRQQKEVNLLKSKHRQQMEELRDRHKSQLDDTKTHYHDMLERVRADKIAKMEAYKEKVQEQRKKSVDQRYRTATRGKIKRVINELNSILNNGTKERNVKFGLQDTVNKALEMAKLINANFSNEEVLMADTMTSLTEKEKKLVDEYRQLVANRDSYNERIEKLQQNTENTNYKLIDELAQMRNKAYKEIKKLEKQLSDVIERNRTNLNDTLISDAINSLATSYKALEKSQDEFIKGVYSEYVYDRIAAFGETIKGTKMQDMTLIQLQEMYDIYKMVMATVRASNQLFMSGKRADINKAVSGVLFELDKRNKAKALPYELADKALDAARDFSYKEMKPVYFFERLGSQTLKEIFFDEARKGEDIFARDTEDAKKFIQTMRAKHGYKSWDMEKGFDITLSSGRKLKLTLGEIMSIYAYSKREQALEHMTNGGFVFNSKEYFKTDKKGKKSVRTEGGIPYRINEFDFVKIKQMMTDEQIKYVDDMQDYLSSVMGAKGNEVSRILYGIDLFKEKYYFPLMSSQDFVAETNKPAGEVSLKNTGMAKATVPHAKNPIVLQSFEDVWANHVGKMSTYHALVLPIENMNKVLNYAEYVGDDVDSVSVKGVIGDLFTKSATDYIKTYIRDLNGGVTTQGAKNPFAKMFTNFKKTAVAASMSTVVQQPTAILRAMAMINPKYFSLKPSSYEEIKKYAPIAILKEMGGFDAGSGRTASGYILQETYEGGKEKATAFFKDEDYRDSILMKGAEKGDELGWGIIWSAVKKEVADTTTYAKGSEEFLQACGERFTEVISYTQVYDSVFSRSEYMRSKNELAKMATAFMGEPTTSFNMLYNAVLQAKRGNINKAQAIGTISAVIVSIIAAAAAKSFIYGLRDDDDDESYLYKYTESLKDSLIGDLNPLNMLPYIKDVISLIDGWDVERTDMALFKDVKDAFNGLFSDSKSAYRKVEDLAGAIAALGGIPLKNVMRTFREGYNFFANIFDDNTGYDGGTPASSEVNELLDKGKDAKAKETIKEILEDKTEKYVKEGYSKAEAEKKAKSSLKSSVTSYWKEMYLEAYENKDSAEMLRIRKILQSTGLYDNVVETCQNWIKNKKNTTETDSEWDKW